METLGKLVMWSLVLLVLMAIAFQACDHFYKKVEERTGVKIESDNIVEEKIEDLVEDYLNLPKDSIDLTP